MNKELQLVLFALSYVRDILTAVSIRFVYFVRHNIVFTYTTIIYFSSVKHTFTVIS